jgi:hypothetical protein
MNENTMDNQFDLHEERRQEREERRALRGGGEWVGGAVLVLIGLLLFGRNMNLFYFNNWWAFFILLPAAGSFATGIKAYQADGRFSARARKSLIVGTGFALVAFMFLFGMGWVFFWPVLLILAGGSLILNGMFPD